MARSVKLDVGPNAQSIQRLIEWFASRSSSERTQSQHRRGMGLLWDEWLRRRALRRILRIARSESEAERWIESAVAALRSALKGQEAEGSVTSGDLFYMQCALIALLFHGRISPGDFRRLYGDCPQQPFTFPPT